MSCSHAGFKLPFLQSSATLGGLGTPNSICLNGTLTARGAAVRQEFGSYYLKDQDFLEW